MATPEGMVTVAEAAKILNRSIEQVRRYLREGKLAGRRIGQQWFISKAALDSWKNGTSLYERRMKLLGEVQELREQIYQETGRLFDGAEMVTQVREARVAELGYCIPVDTHRDKQHYQDQLALLEAVRRNREAIRKETGRLFDGAESVHKSREERLRQLGTGLSGREPGS